MAPNFPFHTPDLDAMGNGLERMSIKQAELKAPQTQNIQDRQRLQERPKPEIRPKNKHVEEIFRLKQKLSDLQEEHDHVQDSMGRMALDLDAAESKLTLKDQELKQRDGEKIALRKRVGSLSAELVEEKGYRAKAEQRISEVERSSENLMAEMQNKVDALATAARKHPTGQETSENAIQLGDDQMEWTNSLKTNNEEVARLQEELMRLTNALKMRDEELKHKDVVAAEAEKRWTSHIQGLTAQFERQLQEMNAFAETRVTNEENLKGAAGAAEAALAVQSELSSAAMEISGLRQRCNFYQNHSERLSKQIKSISAMNDQLQQSVQTKTHEVDVLESLLKSQGYS
jgi:chromosome segregation ATPase